VYAEGYHYGYYGITAKFAKASRLSFERPLGCGAGCHDAIGVGNDWAAGALVAPVASHRTPISPASPARNEPMTEARDA
jgi:hypothetical protein